MKISRERLGALLGIAWEKGYGAGYSAPAGTAEKEWADARDAAVAAGMARVAEPAGDLPA